jgi:L-iditol 2-dehydrogenase
MTEPGTVALHALHQGELKSGDRVAVIGAGPIGLLCALWARALGARDILVTDVDAVKRKFAQGIGLSSQEIPGDQNFDLVVEASGTASGCAAAIMATAPRGRLVLMGNPGGDVPLQQDVYWTILRRELRVVGTWNSQFASSSADEWHMVLDAMATKCLDLTPLISHRIGLAELPKMLVGMRDRTVATLKVLVVNSP